MRTIKFRGKSINTGQWNYGELFSFSDGKLGVGKAYMQTSFWKVLVEPETVGQFTGLTDKNGKEIYEGDLIRFSDRIGKVTWHTPSAQFDSELVKIIQRALYYENRSNDQWKRFEVIGNIHENPELLK